MTLNNCIRGTDYCKRTVQNRAKMALSTTKTQVSRNILLAPLLPPEIWYSGVATPPPPTHPPTPATPEYQISIHVALWPAVHKIQVILR